jgi:EamA domain-containing membrane protein RarD
MYTFDLDIFFIIFVLVLSLIHSVGEAIYKKGTMLVTKGGESRNNESLRVSKTRFIVLAIITFSIGISLAVKLVYGIILGMKPLSVTAGLFLGGIAIFSAILGKLLFKEDLSNFQGVGIIFIALGIFMLV